MGRRRELHRLDGVRPNETMAPEDLPPETTYRLITGLYDSDTGNRLPVVGSGTDYVDLTVVRP